MRRAIVLSVLLLAACSSAPTADRQELPDRPEVPRPEGVEPEGLADMRESLADQRAAAREHENAVVTKPNTLQTTSDEPTWAQEALGWAGNTFGQVAGLLRLLGL
jgi:uncharacterized lipoprotein YmbA